MECTNKMYQEDENDVAVFNFYKKLPLLEQRDCEVFITPENIFGVRESNRDSCDRLDRTFKQIRQMSETTLADSIIRHRQGKTWFNFYIFKALVKQIKIYYSLRPEIIEKYPEFLI